MPNFESAYAPYIWAVYILAGLVIAGMVIVTYIRARWAKQAHYAIMQGEPST